MMPSPLSGSSAYQNISSGSIATSLRVRRFHGNGASRRCANPIGKCLALTRIASVRSELCMELGRGGENGAPKPVGNSTVVAWASAGNDVASGNETGPPEPVGGPNAPMAPAGAGVTALASIVEAGLFGATFESVAN